MPRCWSRSKREGEDWSEWRDENGNPPPAPPRIQPEELPPNSPYKGLLAQWQEEQARIAAQIEALERLLEG